MGIVLAPKLPLSMSAIIIVTPLVLYDNVASKMFLTYVQRLVCHPLETLKAESISSLFI